jgi:hypothetical protein
MKIHVCSIVKMVAKKRCHVLVCMAVTVVKNTQYTVAIMIFRNSMRACCKISPSLDGKSEKWKPLLNYELHCYQ